MVARRGRWGHLASDYASETARLKFDLHDVVHTPESLGHQARRFMGSFVSRIANGGRNNVHENWMRYPGEPLEPSYYAKVRLMLTAQAVLCCARICHTLGVRVVGASREGLIGMLRVCARSCWRRRLQ